MSKFEKLRSVIDWAVNSTSYLLQELRKVLDSFCTILIVIALVKKLK